MKIFSVWNYRERKYDYYQAPGTGDGTHAGTPPTALLASPLGQTPEQGAWTLPVGAQKIGSGTAARGKIASLGDSELPSGGIIGLAIAAAGLYYLIKR